MTDGRQQTTVERWLSIAGSVAAPVAIVSTVLFYFGYVSSRAQYNYFGLDIDTVGLSTQAYVMRSPQPLLVPLLVLVVLGAVLSAAHRAVRRKLRADGELLASVRTGARVGVGILVAGFVLLFLYPWLGSWPLFPLVTPVVIGVGAALAAYCLQTVRAFGKPSSPAVAPADGPPGPDGAGDSGASSIVLLWVTVGACVFWGTATIAQWSGLGLAKEQAKHLTRLPSVILDTKEPLALPSGTSVRSRELVPAGSGSGSGSAGSGSAGSGSAGSGSAGSGSAGSGSAGSGSGATGSADGSTQAVRQFRHQYFHLRLLIQGGGRMFLVPDTWSNRDTTLVVPLDSTVRVQFQFRNDPP